MSEVIGECWLWAGPVDRQDYGHFFRQINHQETRERAHRLMYETLVGPIPEGMVLDHLCRVTRCINPDHLEPVTHRVNILRGTGFSARNARKTHCPQGHPYSGRNLRLYAYKEGLIKRDCRECQNAKRTARYHRSRLRAKATEGEHEG